jgi:hypothetical protein
MRTVILPISYSFHGTRTSYTYDAASQIARVANFSATGIYLSSFDYTRDALGNPIETVELNGTRVLWEYDAAGRQTLDRRESGGGANGWVPFELADWEDWDLNEWETWDLNSSTIVAYSDAFAYDPNGNRITKTSLSGVTTYSYDIANQLLTSYAGCHPTPLTLLEDVKQKRS